MQIHHDSLHAVRERSKDSFVMKDHLLPSLNKSPKGLPTSKVDDYLAPMAPTTQQGPRRSNFKTQNNQGWVKNIGVSQSQQCHNSPAHAPVQRHSYDYQQHHSGSLLLQGTLPGRPEILPGSRYLRPAGENSRASTRFQNTGSNFLPQNPKPRVFQFQRHPRLEKARTQLLG